MTKKHERQSSHFETTQWSLVGRATDDDSVVRRPAMEELLRRYSPALKAYLLRKGLRDHDADDVVQSFIADKILDRQIVAEADSTRGRFRGFLARSLERHLIDTIRRGKAKKRAPNEMQSLDQMPVEIGEVQSSKDAFDLAWAHDTIQQALRVMQEECEQSPDAALRWRSFERRYIQPLVAGQAEPSLDELMKEFGFESRTKASNTLMTAKRQFQRCVRSIVGQYVSSTQEIDAEIADLQSALAAGAAAPGDSTDADDTLDGGAGLTHMIEMAAAELAPTNAELSAMWAELAAAPLGAVISRLEGGGPPADDRDQHPAESPSPTLSALLAADAPDLDILHLLRRRAREAARSGRSDVSPVVAQVIYSLAIAAALVRLGERISKSDNGTQRRGFDFASSQAWLGDHERRLLTEAQQRL